MLVLMYCLKPLILLILHSAVVSKQTSSSLAPSSSDHEVGFGMPSASRSCYSGKRCLWKTRSKIMNQCLNRFNTHLYSTGFISYRMCNHNTFKHSICTVFLHFVGDSMIFLFFNHILKMSKITSLIIHHLFSPNTNTIVDYSANVQLLSDIFVKFSTVHNGLLPCILDGSFDHLDHQHHHHVCFAFSFDAHIRCVTLQQQSLLILLSNHQPSS